MGKPNIDSNFAKKSNLDSHPAQLDEQSYRHAINANLESRDGSSFFLTNEQSNILCSKFNMSGFKVIGVLPDLNSNKTYFFLTNPETLCSEIGYINNTEEVNNVDDLEKICGCDIKNELAEPLENIEQTETCEYQTLIKDCCPEFEIESNGCLNFNVLNPINSVIKKEACGDVIYFTDDLNELRRIEVDEIEQYSYRFESCEDEEQDCDCGKRRVDTCLDCSKLSLFGKYSIPCGEATVVAGGNMPHSVNYFFVAYANSPTWSILNRNEITDYKSVSGAVAIKDPNKNTYLQTELGILTNQSIVLKLDNLDLQARYYNVVVVQVSGLDQKLAVELIGTYPTEQSEVVLNAPFRGSDAFTATDLFLPITKYITAKSLETANNTLFVSNLTSQPEVNLQPVVNLMGEFAKWKTFIAEEDLYKEPQDLDKYRSYMRNEIYTFGIRFLTKDYTTAVFPLINRAQTYEDCYIDDLEDEYRNQDGTINIQAIIDDGDNDENLTGPAKDIYSIQKNAGVECNLNNRTCKWQYYNTATTTSTCQTPQEICNPEDEEQECLRTVKCNVVDEIQERSCDNTYDITCLEDDEQVTDFILTSDEVDFTGYVFTSAEQFINDFIENLAGKYSCIGNEYFNLLLNAHCEPGVICHDCFEVISWNVDPSDLEFEDYVNDDNGNRWNINAGAVTIFISSSTSGNEIGDTTTINFGTNNNSSVTIQITDLINGDPDCNGNSLFGLVPDPENPGEFISQVDEDGCPISTCNTADFLGSNIEFIGLSNGTYENVYVEYVSCDSYRRPALPDCNIFERDTSTINAGNLNINTCCENCGSRGCKQNRKKCDEDDVEEPCCEWNYVNAVGGSCANSNRVYERTQNTFGGDAPNSAFPIAEGDNQFPQPGHLIPQYIEASNDSAYYNLAKSTADALGPVDEILTDCSPTYQDLQLFRSRTNCAANNIGTPPSALGAGNAQPAEFLDKVHNGAAWYQIDSEQGIVIKLSRLDKRPKPPLRDCLVYSDYYRVNLYNGNQITQSIHQHIVGEPICEDCPSGITDPIENYIQTYFLQAGDTIPDEATKTYENVSGSSNLIGFGATFDISRNLNGEISDVNIVVRGRDYVSGEVITILGSDVGGVDGVNDVLIEVISTQNDDSFLDIDGHIIYLSKEYCLQNFPEGILMALDAPVIEPIVAPNQYQEGCANDALLSFDFEYIGVPDDGSYTLLTHDPVNGGGTGALFTVEVSSNNVDSVNLITGNAGSGYEVGEEYTIEISNATITITVTDIGSSDNCQNSFFGYVTGTPGCFTITTETPRIKQVFFSTDKDFTYRKTCNFQSECETILYENLRCDPQFWKEGRFAFWESEEIYPDNKELYDSSGLYFSEQTISNLNPDYKNRFIDTFTLGINQNGEQDYVPNPNTTDFACKKIRHFKFPDNKISPFQDGLMENGGIFPFANNRIFPIGFYLDNNVIETMLDVAVDNNLITQEFRDSIEGYEILRGDSRTNNSITGKGILFDSWEYEEFGTNDTKQFANFPFNDNRPNKFIYESFDRRDYIEHPNDDFSNNKYFFHSPETSFAAPLIPFELEVEAYMLGQSRGKFSGVREHPEMVILNQRGLDLAVTLGILQEALDSLAEVYDLYVNTVVSANIFSIAPWAGWTAFALRLSQVFIYSVRVNIPLYIKEWADKFEKIGKFQNFASYYVAEGHYNKIGFPNRYGNKLRGIADSKYLKSGEYKYSVNPVLPTPDIDSLNINHYQRVGSVFLYLGGRHGSQDDKYHLQVDNSYYRNYDNSRVTNAFCIPADYEESPDVISNIQSPYISLKRYIPSLYGKVSDISWIQTGYCGKLKGEENNCDTVFGGDTFISRFAIKRHFPFFRKPMIIGKKTQAHLTPFSYFKQRNVGVPRFYIDYKVDPVAAQGRRSYFLPTASSSIYEFDCPTNKIIYVVSPSRFYLYSYGIPNFLVESRFNLNYRYARNNEEKDFFPNQTDMVDWTQEFNVSIANDNYYFYNFVYSPANTAITTRFLPFDYDSVKDECFYDLKNRVIYSLPDNVENDNVDNWRLFRARDYNDFGDKYGELIGTKSIESERLVGRFENAVVVFNAYNTLQGSIEDIQLGSGGVFATRPTEFFRTELGYGGTQHEAWVSCEFGHFWVDAKRGRIHQLTPGSKGGVDDITLKGWKNWFRENLPFKIQKQIPNLPLSFLDNAYNGPGITMTWDDRYSRLFVTKRDYKIKDGECCDHIEFVEGKGLVKNLTKCRDEQGIPVCPEGYEPDLDNPEKCKRIIKYDPVITQDCRFDLIFSIDRSQSIENSEEKPEWEDARQFVISFINNPLIKEKMEEGDVQIGVVFWGNLNNPGSNCQAHTINLDTDPDNLTSQINNYFTDCPPTEEPEGTALNLGFCLAHQEFELNGRDQVPKKIIKLTDGALLANYAITNQLTLDPTDLCDLFLANNEVGYASGCPSPCSGPSCASYDINDYQTIGANLDTLGYETIILGINLELSWGQCLPGSTFDVDDDILPRLNYLHTSSYNNFNAKKLGSYAELGGNFVEEIVSTTCEFDINCPIGEYDEALEICCDEDIVDIVYEDEIVELSFEDDCFEECHWTAAYSPLFQTWIGHYDFTPNYYVSHPNYFQSGINDDGDEYGVWSHLLTKKSFQVFYGKKYPWIIEVPVKESYFNKRHGSVAYWLDSKRFHTEFDFAQNRNVGFNHAVIYNHDENTGMLNLIRGEKNNLYQLQRYPIYNTDSIDILATQEQRKWTFNYIFDAVKDKYNNIPIWLNDCANVHKTLNEKAIDYRPTLKNNLRGDWFLIRLYQDQETRHQLTFKWITTKNEIYER